MALPGPTVSLDQDPPIVSNAARARELYKYYQPSTANDTTIKESAKTGPRPPDDSESFKDIDVGSNVTSGKISSPDTALTAFAQLVSWRTGCQRAMISVIDKETQYFIAESTKTVDLVDSSRHGPGDDLWIGCTEVSKAGRLCERTIEVPATENGEFRAFIVADLSDDTRFNQLPFVCGPPFLKFYAGTPLITKRGIPIGSLFVVDERPRNGLSKDELHFMGTMAATIMRHMEMSREVEEHRRGMKMSRGLASFVEGRSQLVEADADVDDEGDTVVGGFREDDAAAKYRPGSKRGSRAPSKRGSGSSIDRKEREYSESLTKKEESILKAGSQLLSPPSYETSLDSHKQDPRAYSQQGSFDTFTGSATESPIGLEKTAATPDSFEQSEASTLKHLFSRAANLIREAFEVDGGSVFYDAQKGFSSEFGEEPIQEEKQNTIDAPSSSGDDFFALESPLTSGTSATGRTNVTKGSTFSRTSIELKKPVEILGFSTPQAASIHGDEQPGPKIFAPLDERSLHSLLRRYPRGKLWMFDEDGPVTSSSEDDGQAYPITSGSRQYNHVLRQRRRARMAAEARTLQRHFPGVRQLLFVPLWDSSRSRWLAGNLTWTTESTRILSKQGELAFLTGFGNSVMAECSRLDTEIADQKKSDFIGSISHELRSPLHGILASAEFLGEELTEGFSKGLVETIDSCGRTLLDTINHILDFSKINHFEKNWRKSRRRNSATQRYGPGAHGIRGTGAVALRQADIPMINLFADVDISVVCEEVVESVFAGHVFQNVTAPSFDMVADSRGRMSDKKYPGEVGQSTHGYPQSEVSVILDVDMQDYHFTTQPGALRRVIMNLLGNALKYTSHGFVKVKLEATEMDDFQPPGSNESIPRSSLSITVSDTGKGISSEFIRSKLFTPFAQENSLSSGTGLGLSIVRSIVTLLEGEIQIKSELGRGTEVKVTLPLLRELPKDQSAGSTPKSATSVPSRDNDDTIPQLRTSVVNKTAALHGFDLETKDPIAVTAVQSLKISISNFLTSWYGIKIVPEGEKADFIVINEPEGDTIDKLLAAPAKSRRGPLVIALCSHSTRFDRSNATNSFSNRVGFLIKPIGPLKLARALSQCLDGVPSLPTPGVQSGVSVTGGISPENSDLSNMFEELTISPNGGEVLDNSRMAAASANARKALESPTPVAAAEKTKEFPFPVEERPTIPKTWSLPGDKETLSTMPQKAPQPPPKRASVILTDMERTATSKEKPASKEEGPSVTIEPEIDVSSPRLLLVDDNKINLRLLKTYMNKRNYEHIDEAENGLEAVHSVEANPEGYDIIFMDISMPVLDGFGATRQIRQLERKRREKKLEAGKTPDNPALVIALTGLASSRDQSEAFTSGVDLFLTKPVSFKEVGKMLDNWQANKIRDKGVAEKLPEDGRKKDEPRKMGK